MTALDAILNSRPSFGLAVLFVTWAAIVLLGLIAVSLHIRVQRLESADLRRRETVPFGHLVGKTLADIFDGFVPRLQPRLVLFLSGACPVCQQLVADLHARDWAVTSAIIWTGVEPPPDLPRGAMLVPGGAKISAALGIRVTPFALVAGGDGTIVHASPVNSLDPLRAALDRSEHPLSRAVPVTH